MQIPKRKQAIRLTPDEPIYLTPEGHARMQARLARLKRELPVAAAEAARTAAYGDRSDNAEYKEAKGIQRRTLRQIWTLEDELKRVVEIKPSAATDTVQLGSIVTVELRSGPRTGAQKKFRILGTLETDPDRDIISHRSPLGAALMGRKAGDRVQIKTNRGGQEYHILSTT